MSVLRGERHKKNKTRAYIMWNSVNFFFFVFFSFAFFFVQVLNKDERNRFFFC